MNLGSVKAGDVVRCDVKGRLFYATVDDAPNADGVAVTPITRGITYRHVTARQVTEHWKRTGAGR